MRVVELHPSQSNLYYNDLAMSALGKVPDSGFARIVQLANQFVRNESEDEEDEDAAAKDTALAIAALPIQVLADFLFFCDAVTDNVAHMREAVSCLIMYKVDPEEP